MKLSDWLRNIRQKNSHKSLYFFECNTTVSQPSLVIYCKNHKFSIVSEMRIVRGIGMWTYMLTYSCSGWKAFEMKNRTLTQNEIHFSRPLGNANGRQTVIKISEIISTINRYFSILFLLSLSLSHLLFYSIIFFFIIRDSLNKWLAKLWRWISLSVS